MKSGIRIGILIVALAGAGIYYWWNEEHRETVAKEMVAKSELRGAAQIQDESRRTLAMSGALIGSLDFQKLEDMAEQFRKNDERTSNGKSKINLFYSGITDKLGEIEQHKGAEYINQVFDDWKADFPDSLTQSVAKAAYQISAAWRARGSGWASTVSQSDWKVFYNLLNQAGLTLAETRKIKNKVDPYSYLLFINLGKATDASLEQMEMIVDESIKRCPAYESTYRAMAENLLPRWHGQPGDIAKFSDYISKQLPQPLGQIIYAQIVDEIWGYERNEIFNKTQLPYEHVRDAYKALIKKYPEGYYTT